MNCLRCLTHILMQLILHRALNGSKALKSNGLMSPLGRLDGPKTPNSIFRRFFGPSKE